MLNEQGGVENFKMKYLSIFIVTLLLQLSDLSAITVDQRIRGFDIEGLRLGMMMDSVIKKYNITTIKSIKDKLGVISGYELIKVVGNKKVFLNFTSEKRLYFIHYYNRYDDFKDLAEELLQKSTVKYGKPNSTVKQRKMLMACWGLPCKTFSPKSPSLKGKFFNSDGRMELILYDKHLLQTDWKQYKMKSDQVKYKEEIRRKKRRQRTLDF